MKVNLISLGCPKNLVDSEVILGRLGEKGYSLTFSSGEADVVIINTCSFIQEARKESYKMISRIISQKGPSQKLVVCGCLPQLEKRRLFSRYPQIDALLGSADFYQIDKVLDQLFQGKEHCFSVSKPRFLYNSSFPRFLTTLPSYAYLKIAEGCSNHCSYCLVPRLRGEYRSRSGEDIIREARALVNLGAKELILIAQDTTFYGWDGGEKFLLCRLWEQLEEIKELKWIRLLYAHPAHFTPSLIKTLAQSKKFCRYLDLPLQHTHDEILLKMGRPQSQVTEKLIEELREKIPGLVLRTTLMVGFPGEEERHFQRLLRDVERLRFDWLGVFLYSPERYTPAYSLIPKIPLSVKRKRYGKLMELQQGITRELNQGRVGRVYPLLADEEKEGHGQFQTPEIEGKVIFRKKHLPGELFPGRICQVEDSYDLIASDFKERGSK